MSQNAESGAAWSWWVVEKGFVVTQVPPVAVRARVFVEPAHGPSWTDSSTAVVVTPISDDPRGSETGPWLAFECNHAGTEPTVRASQYVPLKRTGLYRDFAALGDNERLIHRFADKYGLLGRFICRLSSSTHRVPEAWGEPIERWRLEIKKMAALVDLMSAMKDSAKGGQKGKAIGWRASNSPSHSPRVNDVLSAETWLADTSESIWIIDPDRGEVEAPMDLPSHVLAKVVNSELAMGTTTQLDEHCQARLVPKDLLGAMYIQLAEDIRGHSHPPRQCQNCGGWFVPTDARQVHCGAACRLRAYRGRRRVVEHSGGER